MNENLRNDLTKDDVLELYAVGSENELKIVQIIEKLGSGASATAYKVKYEGSDNNRYLYVLKEIYPRPFDGQPTIARKFKTLQIDLYEKEVHPSKSYRLYRRQFESAYRLQNEMATGENPVTCMTTSLPIGLYEDRKSSDEGNYAVYGLFQYQAGKTLNHYQEDSFVSLIDIQRKIAEVVKAYHEHGFLWLDIKESNVSVVGAGTVLNVSMFDFGSLIEKSKLLSYNGTGSPDFVLSFSPTSGELLLPAELESLMSLTQPGKLIFDVNSINEKKIKKIHLLGKYGEQADIFLLGSLFFKRLFGKAPTKSDCKALQDESFDMCASKWCSEINDYVLARIKKILKKSLDYDNRTARYTSVQEYLADLNRVYYNICSNIENLSAQKDVKDYVVYSCNKYMNNTLMGELGKFQHLKELQGRFDSRVSLRSEKGEPVVPDTAIDSDRFVFLYGDGGMGKSTALYDYVFHTSSCVPIYIELSQYRHIEGSGYIFNTIFEGICKKFLDVTSVRNMDGLKDNEDALLLAFKNRSPYSTSPEFVILLDGYNEMTRDNQGYFDSELKNYMTAWENVRFVITGRKLPDNSSRDGEVYKLFKCYEFIGISDEDCETIISRKYPEQIDKIKSDERLWEVLHIPMFMGMYTSLKIDTTESVHTRGEILEQFIIKTESKVGKTIASGQLENVNSSVLRHFLVQYSLPTVANDMDNKSVMSFKSLEMFGILTKSLCFYLTEGIGENDISMFNTITALLDPELEGMQIYIDRYAAEREAIKAERAEKGKKPLNYSVLNTKAMERTITFPACLHLFKAETGYCYDTADGEIAFTHQYFRDYFAAKHIQNILKTARALGEAGLSKDEQLQFTIDNGLDYTWSDDVCILLGEIEGDYKNEPGYTEM